MGVPPMISRDHRQDARATAFTLIELLVVIAIIATMITVLLPAVMRAKAEVETVPNREIVNRLAMACKSYSKDFGFVPPAAVVNPGATGGTPSSITGAQELRLALYGFSRSGTDVAPGTITPQYGGTGDPGAYNASDKKTYLKFGKSDLASDTSPALAGGPFAGTTGIEMFADCNFQPVMPILYYRVHDTGSFGPGDNPGAGSGGLWTTWANSAAGRRDKFFVVWAGQDRKFFTADDVCSVDF